MDTLVPSMAHDTPNQGSQIRSARASPPKHATLFIRRFLSQAFSIAGTAYDSFRVFWYESWRGLWAAVLV